MDSDGLRHLELVLEELKALEGTPVRVEEALVSGQGRRPVDRPVKTAGGRAGPGGLVQRQRVLDGLDRGVSGGSRNPRRKATDRKSVV